jgi:hypothetical protein
MQSENIFCMLGERGFWLWQKMNLHSLVHKRIERGTPRSANRNGMPAFHKRIRENPRDGVHSAPGGEGFEQKQDVQRSAHCMLHA